MSENDSGTTESSSVRTKDVTVHADHKPANGDPHVCVLYHDDGETTATTCGTGFESIEGVVYFARRKTGIDEIDGAEVYELYGSVTYDVDN